MEILTSVDRLDGKNSSSRLNMDLVTKCCYALLLSGLSR